MSPAVQVEIIGRLGCSTMQGYFFFRPVPQREVAGFIANFGILDRPQAAVAAG